MDGITIAIVVGGVLLGLWLLWKLIGMGAGAALSGHDQQVRQSPLGTAILEVARRGGHNDGSAAAKKKAARAFLNLADHSPVALPFRSVELEGFALDFADGSVNGRDPMMVDAAFAVSSLADDYELERWSSSEPAMVTDLMGTFVALFPEWVKSHRVSSPQQLRLMKARMAMMTIVLAQRAERKGLL